MTHEKAEMGRVREEKESVETRSKKRKKMQVCEKVEKSQVTIIVFFHCSGAPEGPKVGGCGAIRVKNCMRFWREAHVEVKTLNADKRRTTFGI